MPVTRLTKLAVERFPVPATGRAYLWDSKLTGFGLVAHAPSARHPHGKRSFVVRYCIPAQHLDRRMVLGSFGELTVEQARGLAQDVLARARAGEDVLGQKRRARAESSDTVATAFARYHRSRVALGRWKPRTEAETRRMFEQDVFSQIRNVPIRAVERRHIAQVLDGKPPYMANRLRAWLRAFFAYCEREELRPAGSNPCATIERHEEKRRERALDLHEITRLGAALRAIEDRDARAKASCDALRLLLLTGCRRDEIVKLRWSEVQLRKGAIELADTKTGRRVKILGRDALALLHRRHEARPNPSKWVFPSSRAAGKPLSDPRRVISAAFTSAKIRDATAHHVLRHTFATIATRQRVNPILVGLMLGHRKRAGVTEGYVQIGSDDPIVREAEERVQAVIARALDGKAADVIVLEDAAS